MTEKRKFTRRDFLKGVSAVGTMTAATGMLAGCKPTDAAMGNIPEKWDAEADVIVVGFGIAGACAAMEAHDAGAKVLLLEKAAMGGGSTALSGGMFNLGGGTKLQKALGVEETADEFYDFLMAQGGGMCQEELQRLHADKSVEVYDFLTDTLGLEFPEKLTPTEMSMSLHMGETGLIGLGYLGNEHYTPIAERVPPKPHAHYHTGNGGVVFAALKKQCEDREIEIQYETGATELVANADNVVLGLYADGPDGRIAIKANNAVILTAGGYGHNKEIVKGQPLNYMDDVSFRPKSNTGDGIIMAQKLGAHLFVCDGASFLATCGPAVNMYAVPGVWDPDTFTVLYVDRMGARMCNEEWHWSPQAQYWARTNTLLPDELLAFAVFDETSRVNHHVDLEAGPSGWNNGLTTPSGKEIPWKTVSGNTIEELCEATRELDPCGKGIDPEGLKAAVDRWNTAVENGEDKEWGRKFGLVSFETAPFYATVLWPRMANEATGIKINTESEVVDVNGNAISRLYAAGRVTGGQYGQIYTCGTALASGVIMGQIAGKNASNLEPVA